MHTKDAHKRLRDVIAVTIALVPDDHPNAEDLKREITHQRESLVYRAPELAPDEWLRFCGTLSHYVGDPDGRPWVERVARLVRCEEQADKAARDQIAELIERMYVSRNGILAEDVATFRSWASKLQQLLDVLDQCA